MVPGLPAAERSGRCRAPAQVSARQLGDAHRDHVTEIFTPSRQPLAMGHNDDPVPPGLVLSLDEAFRVLEALEDAPWTTEDAGVAPGLGDDNSNCSDGWTEAYTLVFVGTRCYVLVSRRLCPICVVLPTQFLAEAATPPGRELRTECITHFPCAPWLSSVR
jgi:hypothetical protein